MFSYSGSTNRGRSKFSNSFDQDATKINMPKIKQRTIVSD